MSTFINISIVRPLTPNSMPDSVMSEIAHHNKRLLTMKITLFWGGLIEGLLYLFVPQNATDLLQWSSCAHMDMSKLGKALCQP